MVFRIILVIVLIVLIGYLGYLIHVYNKLLSLDSLVDSMWKEFTNMLEKRKDMLLKYIKEHKIKNKDIVNAINSFDVNTNPSDLINAYYKLNNMLTDDMLDLVKMNTNKISKFRLEYNDKALKINNYIDFLPSTFTAHIHKFKKRVYFRDK